MERGRPVVCEDITLQGFHPGGEYMYLGVEQLLEPVVKRAKERAKRRRNPTSVLSQNPHHKPLGDLEISVWNSSMVKNGAEGDK